MAQRFVVSQDSPVLCITVVTKDRLAVFRTDDMKEVVCSAINDARKSAGFLLFAYVVMIDHLHLLTSRPSTTSDVLRVVKGLTARLVIDHLKANNYLTSLAKLAHHEMDRNYRYSLWQTEKNVLPIFTEGMRRFARRYKDLRLIRPDLPLSFTCQSSFSPLAGHCLRRPISFDMPLRSGPRH